MSAVGTLFDWSFTKETGFSGNGKCLLWINETVNRPSALHASRNQTSSSVARVAATCSSAPSSPLAVYAQPPCTFTSPNSCSAHPSPAIKNAAAAAKHKTTALLELLNFAFLRLFLVFEHIGHQPRSAARGGPTSAIPETNNRRSTILRKPADAAQAWSARNAPLPRRPLRRHRSPQHNRLCCSSRAGVGRARLTAKREALRRAGDCATIRPMSAPLLTT